MGLFGRIINQDRSDISAWAKAVIDGYKPGMQIDARVLESATDQLIRSNCATLKDSVGIYLKSKDEKVRMQRLAIAVERQKCLKKLIPFANQEQRALIEDAQKDMLLLDKRFMDDQKTVGRKENEAFSRKQKMNKEDFWTGAGETMFFDTLIDDIFHKEGK